MSNDKFLDAFRALDTELKADNTSVLDYENTLTGTEQEKLKVCRIMRNYMAHNDTTFLSTTPAQTKFLEEKTTEIRRRFHTVKNETKKIKPIKESSPIKDIIAILDKNPAAVLETKTGLYIVNKDILIHQLAQGNKKIVCPERLPKYATVAKDEKIENVGNGLYVVTSDGSINGTYIGIFIKS